MFIAPPPASRRGSALLIVLGLLSFLMISAVAFSISMRTEYAAAASYRRSVTTRELLASAFTDARATVEFAMRNQSEKAGFNRTDPNTRTVEALAPFKYESEDVYGRLIASYNSGATSDTSIAYLLDDAVMRHIPPYVAATVYNTLELQSPRNGGSAASNAVGGENGYRIDWSASWKPITAHIPDDSENQRDNYDYVPEAVIGRMAWAVVNLSDSLDINAIGSTSNYRGIGLTGNEFAFGTAATGSTAVDQSDRYDLIASESSTTTPIELPLFASNADLAQYASQVNGSDLTLDNGEIFPYSWQDAVDQDGDGFYSPFSVYSFWPNSERKKEDGTRTTESTTAPDGSTVSTVIACNEVTEQTIKESGSGISNDLADLANTYLRLGGSDSTIGENFVRLLSDYIDQDSVPNLFNPENLKEIYPHAAPTVERVPMVSEVSFSAEGWENDAKILKDLEEELEKDNVLANLSPDGKNETYDNRNDIPTTLGDQKVEITLPELTQMIGLRAYFPGGEDSSKHYTLEPEGIVGVVATGMVNGSEIRFETAFDAVEAVGEGALLEVDGGTTDVFTGTGDTPNIRFSGSDLKVSLKGDQIPVADPDNPSGGGEAEPVTLTFLVDFLFRVNVKDGSDVVDCSPADLENVRILRTKDNYPKTITERVGSNAMAQLDAQFFRITRPVNLTFALEWDVAISSSEGGETYTAVSKFADNGNPEAQFVHNAEIKIGNATIYPAATGRASYLSSSELDGTWFTIDPRYNWISPMMGVTGDAGGYGLSGNGALRANFSSPHWLFLSEERQTSGNSEPSDIQKDYAAANSAIVPFLWGLEVQDIRYGHNDSGQLLLPAEIGFLPVPFTTNDWHPNPRSYMVNNIRDYYNKVAKISFFRTLPAVNLEDSATSTTNYEDYMRLTAMLKSFAGNNFPEEHRGIVHAFAGQDDYYTCQRLRQFAMLGIPSSITQAAKVTYERLEAASTVSRVSPEMTKTDLKDLSNPTIQNATLKEPKYDTFIRDYLFYVPDNVTSDDVDSWKAGQEPYKGAGSESAPYRVQTADDIILQSDSTDATFVDKLKAYNEVNTSDKLGQNDMTTLLAMARECFGDRQQLFLYILRADSIAYNSSRDLSQHKTLATARAVALVWRDAYGELPDRVVYYQLLP